MKVLLFLCKGRIKGRNRAIRCYDEREWRYVPKKTGAVGDWSIGPDIYTNKKRLKEANAQNGEQYKLSFGPNDIKYVIVKKESERLSIIDAIEMIKRKYTPNVVRKLTSRILTSKQIEEDF